MNVSRVLERIVRVATRWPLVTVAAVALLALVGGLVALRLEPDTGTDTLVNKGSDAATATDELHRRFGGDAVIVLVRMPDRNKDLTDLVLTQDLERLIGLEGCISGNVPRGVTPRGGANGPCAKLGRSKPVKVVYGPGTFINESVRQIQEQFTARQQTTAAQAERAATAAAGLAKARGLGPKDQAKAADQARQLVQAQFLRDAAQLAVKYGISSIPQINDPSFVATLVFDATRGYDVPKTRFQYLFPTKDSALISVRLKPGLTEREQRAAIDEIRAATRMPEWRAARAGATYTVTGAPVVLTDLSKSITDSIVVLLIAALLVMAATLALVFRARLRLLPLGIALAAAGITFGGMSLAGARLTMASIAVLPVLIGLAVDYAIQLQARFGEETGRDPGDAAARAAARGGPTIATAAGATIAGFLVLQLWPVPMVRGFGILLVIGIVVAFFCALTAGSAALALAGRDADEWRAPWRSLGALLRRFGAPLRRLGAPLRRLAAPVRRLRAGFRRLGAELAPAVLGAWEMLAASARGAREIVATMPPLRWARRKLRGAGSGALSLSLGRPGTVIGVALLVAVLGWAADTQTHVVSDVQKLVPQDSRSLNDLESLQTTTGVSGEIDVLVRADMTNPKVLRWMSAYQAEILDRYDYSRTNGCGKARVCPGLSLPDLFNDRDPNTVTRAQITALLDSVPPYFSQAVVSPDHKAAVMSFGIRLMPLAEQQKIIEDMRSRLDPPAGVNPSLAGLPVIAAQANATVGSDLRRSLTTVLGLILVFLVLFAIWRQAGRAFVPLVPIALATGWSALILFLIRVPLNPMSAILGVLVIAISTEFAVRLSERSRLEREDGHQVGEALRRTYRSTGAAVLASGITAVAGFAVLVLSDIRMLRDFGLVTVVDLTASLLGVMLVLPAVIVLAERGALPALAKRAWSRVRRPRRRRTAAA
jgi:hydrophobe/amphiphile efflux-3 (HAE3) family protein